MLKATGTCHYNSKHMDTAAKDLTEGSIGVKSNIAMLGDELNQEELGAFPDAAAVRQEENRFIQTQERGISKGTIFYL